ncbi:hypothetical protein HMPREF1409_00904 [Helicobacter pylori GAM246Ai]|nr:hypothetical protein HMPREF1409_00904 [Helicobacter pylori GAM246Ai]
MDNVRLVNLCFKVIFVFFIHSPYTLKNLSCYFALLGFLW